MINDALKKKAAKIWIQYGKVICEVFDFGKADIVVEPLLKILKYGDEEKIKDFIEYVKEQIERLERIKQREASK